MKGLLCILFVLCIAASCNNTPTTAGNIATGCDLVIDSLIYYCADSILQLREKNENIWNLSPEIDTSAGFSFIDDHFINTQSLSRLVLIEGEAGSSSGSAHNLLIIFDCQSTPHVVWCGQVGDIDTTNLKDLNGDGITDIICSAEVMWMGECHSSYDIFTLKDAKYRKLYSVDSRSVIDCGGADTLATRYKPGDTLETNYEHTLVKDGNKYSVKQVATCRIHNGGANDTELNRQMKIIADTTIIKL